MGVELLPAAIDLSESDVPVRDAITPLNLSLRGTLRGGCGATKGYHHPRRRRANERAAKLSEDFLPSPTLSATRVVLSTAVDILEADAPVRDASISVNFLHFPLLSVTSMVLPSESKFSEGEAPVREKRSFWAFLLSQALSVSNVLPPAAFDVSE